MMNEDKPKKFPNTRAAVKTSMNKSIDGKTMIAIAFYLIFKFWSAKNPAALDPVWAIAIDVSIWVICLLFNIDNPSVAKLFKQIGEFLFDIDLDAETAMKEMKIWYAALGQKYMKVFDSLGDKISDGVIKINPKVEEIKKKVKEAKIPLSGGTITDIKHIVDTKGI